MPEPLTRIEEAEELAVVLAVHQERELPEVRAQLEEALKLQAAIPPIRADAAVGRLTPQQADSRIGAIEASVAVARKRSEGAERLSAELQRRIAEAGRAAVNAMLAEARVSLAQAEKARQEAEELLERRRSKHQLALAHYRQVERDGDALLSRYDPDHAKRRGDQERRKEQQIQWALRQPRMAIEQLPPHSQAEAYKRYDQLQAEAAAYRNRLQERRDGALINPRDAGKTGIRL